MSDMKNLIYLLVIILTIGTFSLNATSNKKAVAEQPQVELKKFTGFKNDISSAD